MCGNFGYLINILDRCDRRLTQLSEVIQMNEVIILQTENDICAKKVGAQRMYRIRAYRDKVFKVRKMNGHIDLFLCKSARSIATNKPWKKVLIYVNNILLLKVFYAVLYCHIHGRSLNSFINTVQTS